MDVLMTKQSILKCRNVYVMSYCWDCRLLEFYSDQNRSIRSGQFQYEYDDCMMTDNYHIRRRTLLSVEYYFYHNPWYGKTCSSFSNNFDIFGLSAKVCELNSKGKKTKRIVSRQRFGDSWPALLEKQFHILSNLLMNFDSFDRTRKNFVWFASKNIRFGNWIFPEYIQLLLSTTHAHYKCNI